MRYAAVAMLSLLLLAFMAVQSPRPLFGMASAAKLNPDAGGNYHVGDGVTAPKAIFAPNPELPAEARQKKITATVLVWVLVQPDGSTKDVHVAKSASDGLPPELKYLAASLDKNALEAARRDRFQPAMFQGKPVAVQIQVQCQYHP